MIKTKLLLIISFIVLLFIPLLLILLRETITTYEYINFTCFHEMYGFAVNKDNVFISDNNFIVQIGYHNGKLFEKRSNYECDLSDCIFIADDELFILTENKVTVCDFDFNIKYEISSKYKTMTSISPVVIDDTQLVLLGYKEDDNSINLGSKLDYYLFSYDNKNKETWELNLGKVNLSEYTLGLSVDKNGCIYFLGKKTVYSISRCGEINWISDFEEPGYIDDDYSNPSEIVISKNQELYFNYNSIIYSFNKNGELVWHFHNPEFPISTSNPIIGENRDVFVNGFWAICLIGKNGEMKWGKKNKEFGYGYENPIACSDNSYVFYGQGNLFKFDSEGNEVWKKTITKNTKLANTWKKTGSLNITNDGRILMCLAGSHNMHFIWTDIFIEISDSNWPIFRSNHGRNGIGNILKTHD